MFCKKCGRLIENGSKFCNVCGTPQPSLQTPPPVAVDPHSRICAILSIALPILSFYFLWTFNLPTFVLFFIPILGFVLGIKGFKSDKSFSILGFILNGLLLLLILFIFLVAFTL